jgi:hypothetical protein
MRAAKPPRYSVARQLGAESSRPKALAPPADALPGVNFSADFQRLLPVLAVAAVAVGAVALVVRGLSGSSSGGSTQQVFDQALGGGAQATSGKFAATLSVSLQGVPGQAAKPVDASFSGAFDRSKTGKPQLDLDGTVAAAGQSFSFGVISTGEQAFVKFRGTTYSVPANRLQGAGGSAAAASKSPLAALGVDPRAWFTDVKDAGEAQLGGVPVQHLTAKLDPAKMLGDLQKVAASSGQAQSVPGGTEQTIRDAVKQATVDVYVGKADHMLRKLTATAQLEAAGTGGPAIRGTVAFGLEVSAVNQPQRISAPRGAAPVSRLDGLDFGNLGSLSGKSSTPPTRSSDQTKRQRTDKHQGGARQRPARQRPARSGTSGRTRSGEAYVACVQRAEDLRALDGCQALLP